MYRLKGVPRAFETREAALSFLRSSPGYVQRRRGYLERSWPGLIAEVAPVTGLERQRLEKRSEKLRGVKPGRNVFDLIDVQDVTRPVAKSVVGQIPGLRVIDPAIKAGAGEVAKRDRTGRVGRVAGQVEQSGLGGAAETVLERGLGALALGVPNIGKVPGDVRQIATGLGVLAVQTGISTFGDFRDAVTNGDLDFSRSRALGAAVVKATIADYRARYGRDWRKFAAEDPLFYWLDALGAAGTAARGVTIGSKIRRGANPVFAVRQAFRPQTGTLREGNLVANPVLSRNAAVAAGQRLVHAGVQRAERQDVDAVSGVVRKQLQRVENAAASYRASRVGQEAAAAQRTSDAVGRSSATALRRIGVRLTLPQQVALRVVHEQAPLDDVIASIRQWASEAKTPKQRKALAEMGKLRETAREYLTEVDGVPMLRTDFRPPRVPRRGYRRGVDAETLAEVSRMVDEVAGDLPGGRERILLDMGLVTPEQIAFRKSAPGRVHMGAVPLEEIAQRFAARLRKEPAALVAEYERRFGDVIDTDLARELSPEYASSNAARAKLAPVIHEQASALAKRVYAKKLARPAKETPLVEIRGGGAGAGKTTAAGAPSQGMIVYDTTLSDLASAAEKVGAALASGRQVDIAYVYRDPAEALFGVLQRAREEGRSVPVREFVESHVKSNKVIRELAKRYATDPRVRIRVLDNGQPGTPEIPLERLPVLTYNEVRDVIDAARTRQSRAPGDARGEGGAAPQGAPPPGTGGVPPGRDQVPAPGAQAPLDPFFGAEEFTGGISRIPDVPKWRLEPAAAQRAKMETGAVPQAPGSVRHGYTGALRRTGNIRESTTRLVAESHREAQRYGEAKATHDLAALAGNPVRFEGSAPIKVRALNPAESMQLKTVLAEAQRAAESGTRLSKAERQRYADAVARWRTELFPDETELAHVPVGESVPGVVWVPKSMLRQMNAPMRRLVIPGRGLRAFDDVLSAMRFSILLAKGTGYVIPQVAGNVFMNIVQQGGKAFVNTVARAPLMTRRYGARVSAAVDEVMGQGATRSLLEGIDRRGAGTATRVVSWVGERLNVVSDMAFRRSAFEYEARRAGFAGREGMTRLLFDKGNAERLTEVANRARAAIGDFERMGPVERDVIRRGVFVYPWLKVATRYGIKFLVEHPVGSNVAASQAEGALRPAPGYASELVPVGGTEEQPYAISTAGANPLSTFAQIAETAAGTISGDYSSAFGSLGGFINPAIEAAAQGAFGRNLTTGQPTRAGLPGLGTALVEQTAPATLVKRWREADEDLSDKTFPYTKTEALGQFLGGSIAPRPVNRDVLEERAQQEDDADLTSPQRARRKVFRERQGVFSEAKRIVGVSELPRALKEAYNAKAAVEAARAQSRRKYPDGGDSYNRDVFVREARLAARRGAIPPGLLREIEQNVPSAPAYVVERNLRRFRERVWGDALDTIREARADLQERGAVLP